MVLQTLVILLQDHGFGVLVATDGAQGHDLYRQHRPDIVVTDIIMPEKEGVELTRELRREFPEAKIIAMSGGGRMGTSDYVAIARGLGADAGLYKPFGDDEFIATLRSLLQPATPSTQNTAA